MTINWWRAVWDFTSHNKHNKTIKEKAMGSGDEGKWWWMDAAKWIVMAAWMLHGACVGEEAGGRNLVFSLESGSGRRWKVPRVCGGCGFDRFEVNRFRFCVLQQVVVPACVILCVSWICDCRSHWNGCMIVATWCCKFATWCCETHCN